MAISKKTATGIAGGAVTAAVSLLLIALHAAKVHVDNFALPMEGSRDVYFCKTAPAYVVKSFKQRARPFWEAHGVKYGRIVEGADCSQTCAWRDSDGSTRNIVCHPGAITVDLMSAEDMDIGSGSPGDRGYYNKTPNLGNKLGQLQWYTLTFPSEIEPPTTPPDENGFSSVVMLPPDVHDLVVAHAFGHAEGLDHTYTKVLGSKKVVARKTGELMNPDIQDLGWGDGGISKK